MITATKEQVRSRFATIPPTLQDAIFSVQIAEIVGAVAKQNNVPVGKVRGVADAVCLVLLGFAHTEDLVQEISARTGLASPVAKTLADSFSAKIFESLKDDLNRAYAPVPHEHELAAESPKPLEDVKKPFSAYQGKSESPLSAPPRFTPTPLPPKTPTPTASATIPSGPPAPFGSSIPRPATLLPFGVAQNKPSVPFSSGPATVGKADGDKEPAPKIIQEEVEFKPLRQQSGFGINIPMPKSLDAALEKEKIPARPAVLEFGNSSAGSQATKQNLPINTELGKAPRVVHYSEYRTPVDLQTGAKPPQPDQSSGGRPLDAARGRDVQEITALSPSVPPAPRSYGSTSRPPVSIPTPPPPTPTATTVNRTEPPKPQFTTPPTPPKPQAPAPRFSDVLLDEKELPPGKQL